MEHSTGDGATYEVRLLEDPRVVVATMRGRFSIEGCIKVAAEARAAAATGGCGVLYDVTEALITLSDAELFEWPHVIAQQGVGLPPRLAVLTSRQVHDLSFLETAAQNAGQNVRLFTDHALALAWAAGAAGGGEA